MAENDPAEQLKRLAELHEQGVLSAAEFAAAKAKVLGVGTANATTTKKKGSSRKSGCGCLVLVIAVVVIIAAIAGSSSGGSGSGNAPAHFTVTTGAVAGLVKNVINNNEDSPGLATPPIVSCTSNGSSCAINYTLKEPAGISAGLELVDPTAQIWKGLFEDPRFHSGVITVSGPLTSQGGQSSTGPMFTLGCNRSDADQINWDQVDAKGIQNICDFTQLIQSL